MLFKPFRLMICNSHQVPICKEILGHQLTCFHSKTLPTSCLQHKMTKISKDHYQFPWTNDMLLLTCIFRLRIQPFVPYSEIADIFMQSQSARLSGVPSTWAKTQNNSEKWTKSRKYCPNSSRLNLIPPPECSSSPGTMSGC